MYTWKYYDIISTNKRKRKANAERILNKLNISADSTIRGFLYQFNKTLEEILTLDANGTVIPEGLVEDIDVAVGDEYKAIQCKYHEGNCGYTDSLFYQPLLEMMLSYSYYSNHGNKNICYVLYIYYNDCKQEEINIDEAFIIKMLHSKNNELIVKYIARLINIDNPRILELLEKEKRTAADKAEIVKYVKDNQERFDYNINIQDFLKQLKVIAGCSYESLQQKVKVKMSEYDMDLEEIDIFFYPNAINAIAEISQNKTLENREIHKRSFIDNIKKQKKILITHWTKQIIGKGKILKIKKEQLKKDLQIMTRKRYFLVEVFRDTVNDFCFFICDYLKCYARKEMQSLPLFFINSTDADLFNIMERILFDRGIYVNNGKVGNVIEEKKVFNREIYGKQIRLALCQMSKDVELMILRNPPDDLFIVGENKEYRFNEPTFNIEKLIIDDFNELKYLLNMRSAI